MVVEDIGPEARKTKLEWILEWMESEVMKMVCVDKEL